MPAGSTIGALLRNSPLDPQESRILLGHALGLSRAQLITRSERVLTTDEEAHVSALMQRRVAGEPIAYIVGNREFYGLSLRVTPDVLIPRPETELLVELGLLHMPPNGRVLDMGAGSGAIAIALAHARPDTCVTALDVSRAALSVAQLNARQHGVAVEFLHSDWFAALEDLPPRQFDLIASNPPYIVRGDPHLAQGDLRFEPVDALTDHADGLSALRAIIAGSMPHLAKGGWLLVEHGYDQAAAVRRLLEEHGFAEAQSWPDLAGIERASGGVRRR